jgi:hypothetical protein
MYTGPDLRYFYLFTNLSRKICFKGCSTARVGLEVVEAISIVVSLGMFIDYTGYLGRGDGEAGTRDARHKW